MFKLLPVTATLQAAFEKDTRFRGTCNSRKKLPDYSNPGAVLVALR
jgi:hypothetical protein